MKQKYGKKNFSLHYISVDTTYSLFKICLVVPKICKKAHILGATGLP
jgi:hypothetical protein